MMTNIALSSTASGQTPALSPKDRLAKILDAAQDAFPTESDIPAESHAIDGAPDTLDEAARVSAGLGRGGAMPGRDFLVLRAHCKPVLVVATLELAVEIVMAAEKVKESAP
jgi:hypothetical protein